MSKLRDRRLLLSLVISAAISFALQEYRFEGYLIANEIVHTTLIIFAAGAWVLLAMYAFGNRRERLTAILSAPFALYFLVWLSVLSFACAIGNDCV